MRLALVAAGMAGQDAVILPRSNLIPNWWYELWDSSWLLREDSIAGRAVHALVGYAERPVGVQLLAFLVVLTTLLVGVRFIDGRQSPRSAA